MEHQPLVTVYIPTYNRVELLKRAVQSVQTQTYQNLEIIIVDDCSTDDTHEYLEQLEKEDQRVRYFIKEKNSGACVSRNIAIENAKGEFITGLDDDDYFLNNRIEEFIINCSLISGDCHALYSLYEYKICNKKNKKNEFSKLYRSKFINKKSLLLHNHIGNQIFTKTQFLREKGGFDENLPAWQDLECWVRLIGDGRFCLVKQFTYVVDKSHPFERISSKKKKNFFYAFNYIVKKHKLNDMDIKCLRGHLYNYDLSLASYKELFFMLFMKFDFYSGYKIFKKFRK